jgi:hypothetical protein
MTAVLPPELKTDNDLAKPAKTKKERPAPPPAPESPYTNYVGQTVVWRQHPGDKWYPAIVRSVNGDFTLRLAVFSDDSALPDVTRVCARHVSDTTEVSQTRSKNGHWDYTEGDKDRYGLKG